MRFSRIFFILALLIVFSAFLGAQRGTDYPLPAGGETGILVETDPSLISDRIPEQTRARTRDLSDFANIGREATNRFGGKVDGLSEEELRRFSTILTGDGAQRILQGLTATQIRAIAQNPGLVYRVSRLDESQIEELSRMPLPRMREALERIAVPRERQNYFEKREDFLEKKAGFLDAKKLELEYRERARVTKEWLESARGEEKESLRERYRNHLLGAFQNRIETLKRLLLARVSVAGLSELGEEYTQKLEEIKAKLKDNPSVENFKETKGELTEFLKEFWPKHRAEFWNKVVERTANALEKLLELDQKAKELAAELEEQGAPQASAFKERIEKSGENLASLKERFDAFKEETGEITAENLDETAPQAKRLARATFVLGTHYKNILRVLAVFKNRFESGEDVTDPHGELVSTPELTADNALRQADEEIIQEQQEKEDAENDLLEGAAVDEQEELEA